MKCTTQDHLPFVIFRLKEVLYGVGAQHVREIVTAPQVTPVPNLPPEIRGVMNLRGKVLKLLDLRVKLGLPSLKQELDELAQLLKDREQDHRNWLTELEACIRERRKFTLARDPHRCKFGLWYDQFKNQDRLLRMTLPSMDQPHKTIHATADEALALSEKGEMEKALDLIAHRRGLELSALIKLFAESRRALSDGYREVVVIFEKENKQLAFTTDLVEASEHIPDDCIEPMPPGIAGLNPRMQCRIAKRTKTHQTILLLGEEFFFNDTALN